jgi:hypothetical protein
MQAGPPPPRQESKQRRRQNQRRDDLREQNRRKRRNRGRKRPQKQNNNRAQKLEKIARKAAVVESRRETTVGIRAQYQTDNGEYFQPEAGELVQHLLVLALILAVAGISLLLNKAAILHLIGGPSVNVWIKLFALIVIPLAMLSIAVWIAFKKREAQELGYAGYFWWFASLVLLCVTPILVIALEVAKAGINEFSDANMLAVAGKIVLNVGAEIAILVGGDRFLDSLGYWSFQTTDARLGLKIWNLERVLRQLQAYGIRLFNEIAQTIDDYNTQYDPDVLIPPTFSEFVRNFINGLVGYPAIPMPGNPNPPNNNPPDDEPPVAPPPPPPAATNIPDDDRDIRRREREVE